MKKARAVVLKKRCIRRGTFPGNPLSTHLEGGFSFCDIFCKLRKGLVIQGEDTKASLKEALI